MRFTTSGGRSTDRWDGNNQDDRGDEHPLPPGAGPTSRQGASARLRFSTGERIRGILQLTIIAVVVWRGIERPDVYFMPLVVGGAFLLMALAVWDDRMRAFVERTHAAVKDVEVNNRRQLSEGEMAARLPSIPQPHRIFLARKLHYTSHAPRHPRPMRRQWR